MSRIERALEKAVKMRSVKAPAPVSAGVPSSARGIVHAFPSSVFDAGEGGVDVANVNSHIVTITDPYSYASEEYRKLRVRVLAGTKKDGHNTIMVTSAHPSEGKSVTAINLAVSISHELDHTVLLVDADLRKPSVHTYLGLKPQFGLSDYLAGRVELPKLMIKSGIGKLVVIAAGEPPENPAELINSSRMKSMVLEIKERYRDRYVIFDTSPLLAAADSLSLCAFVDGVIFVAQAGRSDRKSGAQALSLIQDYNILGSVLNNVKKYPSQSRYPYYYRSGTVPGAKSGSSDDALNVTSSEGQ